MKKRLLFTGLALTLVAVMLVPAAVLAAPPVIPVARHFSVTLTPSNIDDTVLGTTWPVRNTPGTNVWPIVDQVPTGSPPQPTPTIIGWIIDGRSVYGVMSGDVNGQFTLTYGGVVDALQSGSIQGIVTLNSGGLDTIYLAADGDLNAQVKEYYNFDEIKAWCSVVPIPLDVFFSQIYNSAELLGKDEAFLRYVYESGIVTPLPKTLTANFSGTVKIEAGTGAYSGVRGRGQFEPLGKKPLLLSVYPNQHVYKIAGAIKLTGTYIKQQPREIGRTDRDRLQEAVDQFKKHFNQ